MKSIFKIYLAVAVLAVSAAACGTLENNAEPEVLKDGKHVSKMVFRGSVAGYEGATVRDNSTKSESSWTDGDVVYIAFHNGTAIVPGTAVYSESDGWMVSFEGDLVEGESQICEVRFFVNPTFANENLVSINSNTEIYEDVNGSFDFGNGTISVTASMTPKTGRIRFTGAADDAIHVVGITTYSTFSPAGNQFTTTHTSIPLTVGATGSTPYVYGYFTDAECKISIVGSDFAYTRTCSSSIFHTGDSGYMKIPSPSSHMNWKTGLIITVNDVDFKMLPVAGYSGGFFLLAETETTNAQYRAVMTNSNVTPSSYPLTAYFNSNGGVVNCAFFVYSLNNETSLSFYIPTKEEWQFAASGGSISQGYTYAGSNIPGDVAWYSANSDAKTHEVKMLSPNELGFYDMSGNVAEWTSTRGSLTSNSGNYYTYNYYVCGGDYSNSQPTILTSRQVDERSTASESKNGLRLALRFN